MGVVKGFLCWWIVWFCLRGYYFLDWWFWIFSGFWGCNMLVWWIWICWLGGRGGCFWRGWWGLRRWSVLLLVVVGMVGVVVSNNKRVGEIIWLGRWMRGWRSLVLWMMWWWSCRRWVVGGWRMLIIWLRSRRGGCYWGGWRRVFFDFLWGYLRVWNVWVRLG